ncbi:MAG: YbaB/EbfC family nucleoid-associated protein [Alphaproteobacteria bacterium]
MKNLGNMLKEAQKMQAKMAEMQEKLADMELEGVAGGGMVRITVNGKGEMRKAKIDPALADPNEMEILEDLIVAAYNDAKTKVETETQAEMSKLTGGLNLPGGFKLPF